MFFIYDIGLSTNGEPQLEAQVIMCNINVQKYYNKNTI